MASSGPCTEVLPLRRLRITSECLVVLSTIWCVRPSPLTKSILPKLKTIQPCKLLEPFTGSKQTVQATFEGLISIYGIEEWENTTDLHMHLESTGQGPNNQQGSLIYFFVYSDNFPGLLEIEEGSRQETNPQGLIMLDICSTAWAISLAPWLCILCFDIIYLPAEMHVPEIWQEHESIFW